MKRQKWITSTYLLIHKCLELEQWVWRLQFAFHPPFTHCMMARMTWWCSSTLYCLSYIVVFPLALSGARVDAFVFVLFVRIVYCALRRWLLLYFLQFRELLNNAERQQLNVLSYFTRRGTWCPFGCVKARVRLEVSALLLLILYETIEATVTGWHPFCSSICR